MPYQLPPLHQAVLDNDSKAIKLLSQDPTALEIRDHLGFDALEIAQFLGNDEACHLLLQTPPRRIVVVSQDKKRHSLSTQQYDDLFKVRYSPFLRFNDYASLKKVVGNCPWTIAHSFLGKENRELAQTFLMQLLMAHRTPISIRWINIVLGYGLFSDIDLEAGKFVIEFTGLVRQLSRRNRDQNAYCFHYPTRFWSWNYYAIDAQEIGNEARFINHSDHPNLQPVCVCHRRLLHTIFITKRAIKADEQLTYDYGQDFWQKRFKIPI